MGLKIYRISFLSLVFCFCFQIASGQDAFKIDWDKELYYLSAGAAGNCIGLAMLYYTPDLTFQDWTELDRDKVNTFDRIALNYDSGTASSYSDILANGSLALPLIVYALKIKNKEWRNSSIMYLELLMFNGAVVNITKYGFRRTRPYVYNADFKEGQTIGFSGRASFISGHTALASSNSFFAAFIFHKAYPDSAFVPWVYGASAMIPALTGYYRVKAGKHFPTDVISAYLVGFGIAAAVIQIHKRDDLRIHASASSIGLVKTF